MPYHRDDVSYSSPPLRAYMRRLRGSSHAQAIDFLYGGRGVEDSQAQPNPITGDIRRET